MLQKLESISIARAGYNIGYIAGTIIEMLLEILVTGGTAAVVKTVLTVRKSTTTAGKMARTFSKSIAGEISSRLSNILLSIKNNTAKAELQKWIDDLILEIKKALGLVDEAGEVIVDSFSAQDDIINNVKNGLNKLDEKLENGIVSKRKPGDFTRYTNFSELVSIQNWRNMKAWHNGKPVRWKSIGREITDIDTPIEKGIDTILVNELFDGSPPPPKYIINEVKYNTTGKNTWKPTLDKTITKSKGSQMTNKWIENHLSQMFDQKMVRDIIKSHETYLSGVSKSGDEIITYQITQNAKILNKINF